MGNLVSNFGGYRLAMTSDYHISESIQVYKGLITKLMVCLGLAFAQQIIDATGRAVQTLAVNKRSLSHYIWRHNRFKDLQTRSDLMKANYIASHQFLIKCIPNASHSQKKLIINYADVPSFKENL
ncbi:MAG: hypothetical protein HWD61_00835 [Parachlamydiaceae bacterium]|nr:MAG: hypothetical protein HWD61_00835 [Parachlamydiaceae bacterium]